MRAVLGMAVAMAVLSAGGAAQASILTYAATLNGASESPANPSAGTGYATVVVDNIANTMSVTVTFIGLTGTTTASHIHCCTPLANTGTAGVATSTPTFPGFPLGVTAGTYSQSFDLLSATPYNPAFVTANGGTNASAEAALLAGLAAGKTYLNLHTNTSPGGEIRGFLNLAVPEPTQWALMLVGFGALGAVLRRRRALARAA